MPEPFKFTDAQRKTYREAYAPTASDAQVELFFTECERRELIPGVHVFFQLRSAREYDQKLQRDVQVQKVILVTGINALRLIAERSGKFEGYGRFQYYYGDTDGNPTIKSDIPLGKIPHAVGVELFRKGWRNPVFAVARFDACVQLKSDQKPNRMWATRGEEQLAKCAEAAGLRMVAPEECGTLYITEELEHDNKPQAEEVPSEPVTIPQPIVAPAVNQAPAPAALPEPVTPPVAPKPLPQPQATPVAAPAPAPAPVATGLFANTTPLDPAHETTIMIIPPSQYPAPTEKPAHLQQPDVIAVPPTPPPPVTVIVQPAPVSVLAGDTPATPKEYSDFIGGRATKIVRDKLPKGGMKDSEASNGMKNYLLKASGKTGLKQISAATLERLLSVLENAATPEDAAAIVRAQSK